MSDDRPKPLAPPNPKLPSYRTPEERRDFQRGFAARADAVVRGAFSSGGSRTGRITVEDLRRAAYVMERVEEEQLREYRERSRASHERFAAMVCSHAERGDSSFRYAIRPSMSFAVADPEAPYPEPQTLTFPIGHVRHHARELIRAGLDEREAWLQATWGMWRAAREIGLWE